jgi:response regulator NasT
MRHLRILVVEDDGRVAEGLEAGLRALGHEVTGTATDGGEAVAETRQRRPDVVLMDIQLPTMDGIEAARQILAEQLLPIVFITGHRDEELVRRGRDVGAMAYLLKPLDLRQLASTLQLAVARFEELKLLREQNRSLQETLEARKLVERAKGIVMDRLKLTEAKAFALMRERSRQRGLRLRDVAAKILEAEEILRPSAPGAAAGPATGCGLPGEAPLPDNP